VVAVAYGSVRPAANVFVDGVLGYGTLDFDSRRYTSDGFATGSRHGNQVFGAVVAGIEYRDKGWLLSPYGRLELMSARLDQYTETATGTNALTFFKQTVRTTSGTLGLRAEGQYATSAGTLMPHLRAEFRHRFDGAGDAPIAYADLAATGPAYVARSINQDSGNWMVGLGARLLLRSGLTLTIDYNSNLSIGNGRSQSVMLGASLPF